MSDPETGPAPLESRRARDKLARFDPTITMGSVLQMVVVAAACIAAYGKYSADQAKQTMEIEQVKQDAVGQRTQMKEQMSELRIDVKEVQRSVSQIDKSLAEMKAQQQLRRAGS